MLRIFNAFQIVTLFSALPFVAGWLWSEPSAYGTATFWVVIVAYLVAIAIMTVVLADSSERHR